MSLSFAYNVVLVHLIYLFIWVFGMHKTRLLGRIFFLSGAQDFHLANLPSQDMASEEPWVRAGALTCSCVFPAGF